MPRHTSPGKQTATRIVIGGAALALTASLWAQTEFTSWPARQAPPQYQALITRGDLIVGSLQDSVLRELRTALTKAGPEGAMAFCHLDATFLAQRLARYEGVAAGRTSDRLRNPNSTR
jgi:hypothetical protein